MDERASKHWCLLMARLLAAVAGVTACRSEIEAKLNYAPSSPSLGTNEASEPLVRVFDVESLSGLQVDAAASGLGLDFRIPQDASVTPTFKLTVALTPPIDEEPLYLMWDSDKIESLERPIAIDIPKSLLPEVFAEGSAALVVKDSTGIRRVVAPDALRWEEKKLSITTSQPLGEWSFVSSEVANTVATYFVITTAGLMADESVRYEIAYSNQRLVIKNYEIGLPDQVIRQKVTGEETRSVSASSNVRGIYQVRVLEAPVEKTCAPVPETGMLQGRVAIAITCE